MTSNGFFKKEGDAVNEGQVQVEQDGDKLWVSSRDVAEKFGKPHGGALRALRKLMANDMEFWRCNFASREYQDDRGKFQPFYLMTRDGFSILAMGFTGLEAFRWKVLYIKAFNRMEEELAKRALPPPPLVPALPVETREQKVALYRSGMELLAQFNMLSAELAFKFTDKITNLLLEGQDSGEVSHMTVVTRLLTLGYDGHTTAQAQKIGKVVASEYRDATGREPITQFQRIDGQKRNVKAYEPEFFYLIDAAAVEVLGPRPSVMATV